MKTSLGLGIALLLFGCSGASSSGPSPLLEGLEGAPPEINESCRLAAKKCVRCHSVERIMRTQVVSPVHWHRYVTRMRMQPNSGIGPRQGKRITQCLVYRSFGETGLASLRGEHVDE